MTAFWHRVRGVRSKGAVLVQLWSFAFFVIMVYLSGFQLRGDGQINDKGMHFKYFKLLGLALPIAGFLSDVFVGRYKIVRYSMWLLFISLIAYNLVLVLLTYGWHYQALLKISYAFSGLMILGAAGAVANSVQLGIDQLIHASSSDIQSYISWYVWSFSLANAAVSLTQACFCRIFNQATAFFLFPFLCAMVIASDFVLSQWLIKEPVLHNPLKLIFHVLKYAIKNKRPRLRSAFTYWDDKPLSRIDVGKAQYGGPFTNEQVEDVKTFFRFVAVTAIYTPLSVLLFLMFQTYQVEILSYQDSNFVRSCLDTSTKHYMTHCYQKVLVAFSQFVAILIIVPVFEFALYPFLVKFSCFYRLGMMQKVFVAIILMLMYYICFLSLKVSGIYILDSGNATCFLSHHRNLDYTLSNQEAENAVHLDYRWLVGTQIFTSFTVYLSLVSAMELSCAQSPYSMKGTLMGVVWLQIGTSYFISELTIDGMNKVTEDVGVVCGVWFYAALVGVALATLLIQVLVMKFYTFRKRDETLSNDQMFAVDYFNKYLPRSIHPSAGNL